MASNKFKDYLFECVYCDPKLEMYLTTTQEAMIKHCRIAHNVDEQQHANFCKINELPALILAQIFEKLPWENRLKIEQVCKNWQHVGKNLSWSNYRIFKNSKRDYWPDTRAMHLKSVFERCGRYLRHLTLHRWSPQVVLSFVKMAPNVQHLKLWFVDLNDESLKELAGIVPGLKSLSLTTSSSFDESHCDYNLGLMECFKGMTSLEYLHFYGPAALFSQYSFVQFPSNIKYLVLHDVRNAGQILSWVAEGCKNLKGLDLRCSTDENLLRAISQIKSLTYLAMALEPIPHDIGYVLEELTELRALETYLLDVMTVSAIAQHCKKLEHLEIIYHGKNVSAEMYANTLRLASLPNLCSIIFGGRPQFLEADGYSEKTTEIVNRLIAKCNLQYIEMKTEALLEPEVLLEMLRRCKSIRFIGLSFDRIDADFYSKICQVVDEVDERDRQQRELTADTHPIVAVEYNEELSGNITTPYKWIRFTDKRNYLLLSAVREKWKFGCLSVGKPEWES